MAKERIFTSKKRRVLRKQIPFVENFSGLLLLGGLTLLIVWFLTQKENFDPRERDLSLEQLLQKKAGPQMYNVPFKPWIEPGTAPAVTTENLGLFPQTILAQGWQISSRLKQFEAGNLYEKINGEAEKFIRQGFLSLHYIALKSKTNPAEEIAIELFDQGNLGGSLGIFADHRSEDKILEEEGPVIYFRTSAGAIGRKDQYFFRVAGNQSTKTIQDKSSQLMKAFAELPASGEAIPQEFRILNDVLGLSPKWISYQKQNVFQYDFVENFWFGQIKKGSRARIFIHEAASAEAARLLFDDILAEHSYDYQIVEEEHNRVLMFHEFLKNYFVIHYAGPFVFGMENTVDQNQGTSFLKTMISEFEDG